ncbi:degV family protein [Caldalkalibacillus thermarum TA2.A1]|uniref:DegV family protein n=1 Tax=Caldalkalibacillus thermarum (strain TA2.A1) TaxID=986075 RepID=F5L9B5_CALTT|nr:DegV family protein [Caldalkalibacillus thermarum]EGL82057.1 degV family protein [Caldalkalibacillus thermarum TA2.A1]QZT34024.1 DegV family protein [Caldalkalibacillus thermarum TA2.A1]
MSKIAIVTDSTAYLSRETIDKYRITVVPLSVIFGNQAYREGEEIGYEEFYRKLKESDVLPTTSQPSVGDFVKAYERLAREYDEAISIHLSSGISGTYQAARQAADLVENFTVHLVDSEITCAPQALMAEKAAQLAEEGKTAGEIVAYLEELKRANRAYFVVDDLSHLHRGGRLNAAQLLVGSMLRIKPVLHFVDKKIVPFEKIRTKKKAKARIMELLAEEAKSGQPFPVTVVHANAEEEALAWRDEVQEHYPHLHVQVAYIGPVIGTHVGEGTLGLTWNTHPSLA